METNSAVIPQVHRATVAGTHIRLQGPDAGGPGPERYLSLGSQDLIRFGAYAERSGWALARFELADAQLDPLPQETQERVSAEMLYILATYGEAELDAAMRDEFDNLYAIGVKVVHGMTGAAITLRRRGFVDTTDVPAAETLISAAWREMRLC